MLITRSWYGYQQENRERKTARKHEQIKQTRYTSQKQHVKKLRKHRQKIQWYYSKNYKKYLPFLFLTLGNYSLALNKLKKNIKSKEN